jgi:ABC-2 type transport system ATP-binding protein
VDVPPLAVQIRAGGDIEALCERILLIGKGKILLDGSLSELKKRSSSNKTITLEFNSGDFEPINGITLKSKINGHAVFVVDTNKIPISDAVSLLSKRADISDISIVGTTAEEMVVSLYEEFKI